MSLPAATAPPLASPAAQRVAALAVRLLEVPAALVLRRIPGDGPHVLAASGEQADRLTGELLRHSRLLDTERDTLVIPDLEDAADLVANLPAPLPGTPRLRFLAAAVIPSEARTPPDNDKAPSARDWLCLLDSRARQFRAADRQLLQEFAQLIGDAAAPPPAPETPLRTADMIDLSLRDTVQAATSSAADLEERLRELSRLNDSLRADLNGRQGSSLEQQGRFEQLIDGTSDFIGLASLDGKLHYLNRAGQKLVGLDGEDAVRKTRLLDYLMREDRSYFLGTVTPNLMRTGTWEGDFRFRHFKTGATIEVSWTLFLIRDPQTHEPADIAVVTRDITERKKQEAALRESEERFRHLVEQAGEAFFVYDLTGRVIDVNQEACESLGYSRADLLALSVGEIDMEFDPAKGRERWKQMVPGVAMTMTGTHRRKDGTTFPTEERVAVFRSGNQRLLLALVRDITDRKRAEEAIQQTQEQLEARVTERTVELARANDAMREASHVQVEALEALRRSEVRFSRMTANVPGMVYQLVIHGDGTADFPYVSEGCRALFGLEPADMRPDACTLLDRIHPDDIGGFLSALDESRQTGTAWTWEGRYLADGNEERWLQGAARPESRADGDTLWDGLLLDITKRKLAEVAINFAKEEAEKADRAKSEFLSRMSHELRTPLNAILGFGQVLQMQKLPGAQNDRVGHIVTAGRHLLSLINEVLDISRIEAGRVELSLEPVSVAEAVDETLDLIRPLANERGVQVQPVAADDPLHRSYIMADRQRFKQVLLNLLSNAVKYNRPGGTVRLEYLAGAGDKLRLNVVDTGVGVPQEKLARLFVAFDRLGAENTDVQGTGLGLALSKRLIEAMGGGIGVQSVVAEGTTFWIELPRAQSLMPLARGARLDASGPPSELATFAAAHTVLYIEDNLSNLTLIEHLLADHPEIKLMTAMQGGLGLELARQHHPDLILLDLHLPDLPGWDVLAQLKADDATRAIPVVVVSADATPRQVERLMKGGAHSYLTKPLEVDRFQRTLRQVLEPAANDLEPKSAPV